MKTFMEFWAQLLLNVESFAAEKWNELKDDAVGDAEKFLTDIKDDVQRWISLLAEGKLSTDELTWLLKGK